MVARQPLGRVRRAHGQVVPQRVRRTGRRRREPRHQRDAEREREQHLVEPRRHVPPLQHEPADRRRAGCSRRSHSANTEVPRGSVPRSLPGRSAARRPDENAAGRSSCRTSGLSRSRPRRGRTRPRSLEAGRDRVRRHQTPTQHRAVRCRRGFTDHQPRRSMAASVRQRRRAAEPVRVFARRDVARARGGASVDVDRRSRRRTRSSRPTAARCSISSRAASR